MAQDYKFLYEALVRAIESERDLWRDAAAQDDLFSEQLRHESMSDVANHLLNMASALECNPYAVINRNN